VNRLIRSLWLTAATVALSACSAEPYSDSRLPATPGASQPRTASRSSTDDARHRAIAAYMAMWSDVAVAAATSDWRSPRLAQHASGDALSALSRALFSDHQRGLVSRGEPSNDPSVSSATPPDEPTAVLLSDCGNSTRWLKYDAKTGEVADDSPGGRRAITAEVKLDQGGSWKVTRFAVGGLGTC
jgi:hypothetical protein